MHTASMTLVPKTETSKQDNNIELLSTKLSIPASRITQVARDRLLAKLSNGLCRGCQLILVSAPAGAGKTTLLSSWLRQLGVMPAPNQDNVSLRSELGLAWLTLDRDDNQPLRFWSYLIGALQTIDADLGREAQWLLMSSQHQPTRNILSSLLNDIATYPDQILLVLDDFEAITASAVHKGMVFIVDHAPPQLHLVLSSRVDPPLPLARFRAHNQLAEVRGKELDFTIDETIAFLSSSTGMTWRKEEAWALHARTEGWAAGLQIASLDLQKLLTAPPSVHIGDEIARFVEEFSGDHHDIRDFLEQEVLKRQPPHIQSFLLRTSILTWLNGSLCDLLTEQLGNQKLIDWLVSANLFVAQVEGARPRYRYHRMFAEVLRARLRETQPSLAQILHRRAAKWYEEHGDGAEASNHRLQAEHISLPMQTSLRSGPQISPIGVAEPLFAGSRVIVVDQPLDDDCSPMPKSANFQPASGRADLPELSARVQERVPQAESSQTDALLDHEPELVPVVEHLTQRELEILRLIAEDLSYKEISDRLVIGLNTVRFHVKNIYGKLAAHRRTQAIAHAKKLRLLLP